HAGRSDAAQLRRADALSARELGADARERYLEPGRDVRRAADDGVVSAAVVDLADPELLGIRVRLETRDPRYDDVRERRRGRLDGLDLETEARQRRGQRVGVADGCPLAQPVDVYAHDKSFPVTGIARAAAGRSRRTSAGP